jgi:hypothetical protein
MDQIVDSTKRSQLEYSTQFFGFSPDSLIDTIIGDATEIAKSNIEVSKGILCRVLKLQ